ncbi:Phosphoglucomutase-1 [Ketogulonicigenium vulgare]|uniref:phosphoglucomutase (alpha-D-glucose-1,6-bisphosphate-dependent) n=1 Tax=Ketogulonicigenium vulgare (strain WSH-001) TaxID=759362 RepID=F9Y7D8_KETVW|nr:Phosphoglucomutase-1 [Ketogulonicigenium vulgare WSH-001]AOZ54792.1 Phosphoglucomutase-1 [Ketogulonicigenium vulgare]
MGIDGTPKLAITTQITSPITGQKPGTSGLRKQTTVFMQPHYLENYVQAIFDGIGGVQGKTLVLGGDGRFFNDTASATILRMAAANGAKHVIVGRNALLSTPAASHLIRKNGADGGLILSASHNPGGEDGDFGLKFNSANGGPAAESITDAIYEASKTISQYLISDQPAPALDTDGTYMLDGMVVEVIDPVTDYAALMETLFDFNAIRSLFASGFRIKFDAMHAATGPYAREIFVNRLGATGDSVINDTPLPDFGGGHPDPNPIWASELVAIMSAPDAPDFGAASDGDGDRNMIMGRGLYVSPSDSLALLAAQMHLAPAYKDGLKGIARSMPTSAAADRVAVAKGVCSFETPTGWKFFGNLLDSDMVSICGEESAGTGSNHVREKDGLWAVLLWLNILAVSGKSVTALMQDHWATYGRDYYTRHDYENIETERANAVFNGLRDRLADLPGQTFGGLKVERADEFNYDDPVDQSHSAQQGLRVFFNDGARAVLRLSGTGTVGATLRLYLEQPEPNLQRQAEDPQAALARVIAAAGEVTQIAALTGRDAPDVIS